MNIFLMLQGGILVLNTFEDILPIFGVICSGSVQPLSCGVWLTYKNYT